MELDEQELEATRNRKKSADEMFEELGYEKDERCSNSIEYIGEDEDSIAFINGYEFDDDKCIRIQKFNECITIEELQAINKKVEELRMEVEKCEYCKNKINNKKIRDIDKDKEDWLEIIYQPAHKFMIYVELDGTDSDGYKTADFFKIKYCPMCR